MKRKAMLLIGIAAGLVTSLLSTGCDWGVGVLPAKPPDEIAVAGGIGEVPDDPNNHTGDEVQ